LLQQILQTNNANNIQCLPKCKRYSNAAYPRKYAKGSNFQSEQYGTGLVVDCKQKIQFLKHIYWNYSVEFQEEDGQKYVEEFSCEANEGIVMNWEWVWESQPK